MTDMLDKCAKAMQVSETWSCFWSHEDARKLAASVIRALMEPTPEMVEAMTLMDVPEGMRRASNFQYRREFRAALRTLLPEEPKS